MRAGARYTEPTSHERELADVLTDAVLSTARHDDEIAKMVAGTLALHRRHVLELVDGVLVGVRTLDELGDARNLIKRLLSGA